MNLLRQTLLCTAVEIYKTLKDFKPVFHEGIVYIKRKEEGCS